MHFQVPCHKTHQKFYRQNIRNPFIAEIVNIFFAVVKLLLRDTMYSSISTRSLMLQLANPDITLPQVQ